MTCNRGFAYRERIRTAAPLLDHLALHYRHSSQAQWRERIEQGELELDGRPATLDTLLAAGQELVWHRPPWTEPEVARHGHEQRRELFVAGGELVDHVVG